MAFRLGVGFVDMDVETGEFDRKIDATEKRTKKLGISLEAVSRTARRMLVAGAAAVGGAIALAGRQAEAEAKLAAVVRATGQAAGFTADELKAQAAALQKVTTSGDESIMAMQAILLTFKQIKGVNFERATEAVLDVAEVMGTDAKSAALQLGKALNDPLRGLDGLNRAGIQFSQEQKAVIKGLVETGRVAEAQGLILDELASQFGGTARAMAGTPLGQLKQVANAFGDIGEEMGKALLPALMQVVSGLQDMLPTLREWVRLVAPVAPELIAITGAVVGLVAVLPQLVFAINAAGVAIAALAANPMVLLFTVLGGVALRWGYMEAQMRGFPDTVGLVVDSFQVLADSVNDIFQAMIDTLAKSIQALPRMIAAQVRKTIDVIRSGEFMDVGMAIAEPVANAFLKGAGPLADLEKKIGQRLAALDMKRKAGEPPALPGMPAAPVFPKAPGTPTASGTGGLLPDVGAWIRERFEGVLPAERTIWDKLREVWEAGPPAPVAAAEAPAMRNAFAGLDQAFQMLSTTSEDVGREQLAIQKQQLAAQRETAAGVNAMLRRGASAAVAIFG